MSNLKKIKHFYVENYEEDKKHEIVKNLQQLGCQGVVIFCSDEKECEKVSSTLTAKEIWCALYVSTQFTDSVLIVSSQKNQLESDMFEDCPILITTDSVGLLGDVTKFGSVINWNCPSTSQLYAERVGWGGGEDIVKAAVTFVDTGNVSRLMDIGKSHGIDIEKYPADDAVLFKLFF